MASPLLPGNFQRNPARKEEIAPERSPAIWIPVAFFATAVAFLAAALALATWRADMLLGEYKHTSITLALLHLYVLGWGTTLVMGAVLQMAPVVMHGGLHSGRLALAQLAIHAAGVVIMATGFWRWESVVVIAGACLVVTSVCLWAYNAARTMARGERRPPVSKGMAAALCYLLLVAGWGLTLALNLRWGFLKQVELGLGGHLALGAGGWFTLMIATVSFKLVPMFAVAPPPPRPAVAAVLAALGTAPLGIAVSLVLAPAAVRGALAAGLIALWTAGAVAYTALLWRTIARRAGRRMEPPVRFAGAAAGVLPLVAVLLLAGVSGAVPALLAEPRRAAALALLGLLGFMGTMGLGQLHRILAFLVWLDRFRRRTPGEHVPFLHEIAPRTPAAWVLALWLTGAFTATAALALGAQAGVRTGLGISLAAVLLYAAAAIRSLGFLRKPDP